MDRSVINIVVVVAFVGSLFYSLNDQKRVKDERQARVAAVKKKQKDAQTAKGLAAKQAEIEGAKYKDAVDHDSKPETKTYPIRMDGSDSYDPDKGDKLTFLWTQTAGNDVKLSDQTKPTVTFEGEAGEYTFELAATDNYGISNTLSKTIKIGPEPNEAPIVVIDVSKGK